MRGKLVIIVGPSGTGKSTLINQTKEEFSQLIESISYTTRDMRPGEVDGVSYFFVKRKEFEEMIDEGDFLEWFKVHDEYKGTSKKFVDKKLANGEAILFDVDVQGADALKAAYPDDAKVIFVAPPSFEELERRLKNRGTETEESLQTRLDNAKKELLRKDDYDYLIVNDDVEQAYVNLREAVSQILQG